MNPIIELSEKEIASAAVEVGFSGVISISTLGQETSLDFAFGFAERGHGVLNRIETRFALASGSKIFTAVAIGLLIEEGKIGWETRLADCVRSRKFPFPSEITIGQLLNHTSGVPDYFDEEEDSGFAELWQERPCYGMTSISDFLPLFENKSMKGVPGIEFHYSNSGYILLGLVIEEMTGHDFRRFVQERVILPCDMVRSGYFSLDALPENTANGYLSKDTEDLKTNIYSLPSIGGADGGAFTTSRDLRRFWNSLLRGGLLPRAIFDRFISPSVLVKADDGSRHYGYGVWLKKIQGNWILSLIGSDPGASMVSRVWLNEGLILTVLSNTQEGARDVGRILDGKINSQ